MTHTIARAARLVSLLILVLTSGLAAVAADAGASEVIYNDIPSNIQAPPGTTVPFPFEFYKTSEFGAQLGFAGTARKNPDITVVMGSEACETGSGPTCTTAAGAKFDWPVTFTVYSVGPNDSVGQLLATGSKVFAMPYRPSANARKCTGAQAGDWYSGAAHACLARKAFKIALPLRIASALLPNDAIVSLSYDTTDAGSHPTGEPGPYDSLSVAVSESASSVLSVGTNPGLAGANPEEEGLYVNSTESYLYCVSPPPVGTFALTGLPCGWNNNAPLVSVKAAQ
jgi:hypothetical protein